MIKPPIPADEEQRLEDLRRLDMLLHEPEEEFDRMMDELARIFNVAGALMSFIDRDTQYYKSATKGGIPREFASSRREPREISVCSFVVGENDVIVVDDLLSDDRFRDNPVVVDSGARFYAGAPLRAESGRAIGTLCLVDDEPRTMEVRERELLQLLAEGVMARVRLHVASRQLLERTKQIERDLAQAVQMQRFLLPPPQQEGDGWRISQLYRPFEHLGGDFVDVHRRPDGRLAILVADVSGHGTSSALTVAMTKTAFHRVAPKIRGPAEVLTSIHRELVRIVPPGQFMTAWAALFDPARRGITVASAGHPHPLLVRDGRVEVVRHETEIILLVEADQQYGAETTVQLTPGDRLLVYTDGAIEAVEPGGDRLELAGLSRLVEEAARAAPDEFLSDVMSRLRRETGNVFHDDVALLCIESV